MPDDTSGASMPLRVSYYMRHQSPGRTFSIEHLFRAIIAGMPAMIRPRVVINPFATKGLARILANVVVAAFRQADVNHVTGDVHYVTYLLRKRRTILTIHDVGHVKRSPARQWLFLWMWFRLPARRVTLISVDSEFSRQEVLAAARCDPAMVHVVPCCILPVFRRIDKAFDSARPTVLQVGTARNKNIERLAEALAGLPCRLHVIGHLLPAQREALVRWDIDFVQSVNLDDEQLLQAYAECDVVSFVSTYEGFGLPIIEAQTVGRPVVTGNCASMPEVAGNGACVVDPFDTQSIRAGIVRVISDAEYRDKLRVNGYENAKRFSVERVASQFATLYGMLRRAAGTGGV